MLTRETGKKWFKIAKNEETLFGPFLIITSTDFQFFGLVGSEIQNSLHIKKGVFGKLLTWYKSLRGCDLTKFPQWPEKGAGATLVTIIRNPV